MLSLCGAGDGTRALRMPGSTLLTESHPQSTCGRAFKEQLPGYSHTGPPPPTHLPSRTGATEPALWAPAGQQLPVLAPLAFMRVSSGKPSLGACSSSPAPNQPLPLLQPQTAGVDIVCALRPLHCG